MKTILKSLLVAGIASLAVGAVTRPAFARTTTANAGSAFQTSETGCFSEYYGSIINNGSAGCSGPRTWLVAATVDHVGWTNFWVGGAAASLSSDVSCRAIGASWDGYFWDLYPAKSLTSVNVFQQINVSTYHSGNGSPYLACSLAPNGRITTVTY